MTFENLKPVRTREQGGVDGLDLSAVCPEGHPIQRAFERSSQVLDGAPLLESPEYLAEQANKHWHSIIEKFDRLPPQYQALVFEGIAPHMTGESYPSYDRLRSYCA